MTKIINFPIKNKLPESQDIKIPIEKATHWIPREIKPYCEGMLRIGKAYKIEYSELHDDFYIKDDYGSISVWFLTVDGEYVQCEF